jgi:NAD(P)-dependent dehydrogenase (short-subunit alcohol dehydrogenase family)
MVGDDRTVNRVRDNGVVTDAVGELCLHADVTDEAQVGDLYARVRDELGRIDVLFNNAGVNDPDDGSA